MRRMSRYSELEVNARLKVGLYFSSIFFSHFSVIYQLSSWRGILWFNDYIYCQPSYDILQEIFQPLPLVTKIINLLEKGNIITDLPSFDLWTMTPVFSFVTLNNKDMNFTYFASNLSPPGNTLWTEHVHLKTLGEREDMKCWELYFKSCFSISGWRKISLI